MNTSASTSDNTVPTRLTEQMLLERDPTGRLLSCYQSLPRQREYVVLVVMPGGAAELPVFASSDAQAIQTFDSMVMLWHNNRRLYPSSTFERFVYPDATALVLLTPDRRTELVAFELGAA